jgi:hypothetical protein
MSLCVACKKTGHRIHSCPDEKKQEAYYETHIKELPVVRSPVVGKYYEATFYDSKKGNWDNEKYFVNETTPRRYVGKYLRHIQQGYGDGADHWAIFLIGNQEIEVEYDYDGKRAFFEVLPKE